MAGGQGGPRVGGAGGVCGEIDNTSSALSPLFEKKKTQQFINIR